MKKATLLMILLLAAVGAAGSGWWLTRRADPAHDLVLYGNVDLRQVELAFNNSERIAAALVEESDRLKRGQVLARPDTSPLRPGVQKAEAKAVAQGQAVERLHHGSRREEIAQARANVALAKADAINARGQYVRRKTLAENSVVSRHELDNAEGVRCC